MGVLDKLKINNTDAKTAQKRVETNPDDLAMEAHRLGVSKGVLQQIIQAEQDAEEAKQKD